MAAPSTPKPIDVGDGAVHSSPAVPPLSLSPSRSPSPRPRNPILGRRPSSPLLHPPRSSSPRSAKSSHKGASPRSASAGRLSARSASVASTSNEPPPTPRKKKESRQLRGEIKGVVTSLRKSAWLLCDVKAVAALRSPHPSPQPLLHIIPALLPSCVVLSAHCASIHLCAYSVLLTQCIVASIRHAASSRARCRCCSSSATTRRSASSKTQSCASARPEGQMRRTRPSSWASCRCGGLVLICSSSLVLLSPLSRLLLSSSSPPRRVAYTCRHPIADTYASSMPHLRRRTTAAHPLGAHRTHTSPSHSPPCLITPLIHPPVYTHPAPSSPPAPSLPMHLFLPSRLHLPRSRSRMWRGAPASPRR